MIPRALLLPGIATLVGNQTFRGAGHHRLSEEWRRARGAPFPVPRTITNLYSKLITTVVSHWNPDGLILGSRPIDLNSQSLSNQ
jgi:hypothetical protein